MGKLLDAPCPACRDLGAALVVGHGGVVVRWKGKLTS
jgi:hypothetical protein